jgi:hypothetical protein
MTEFEFFEKWFNNNGEPTMGFWDCDKFSLDRVTWIEANKYNCKYSINKGGLTIGYIGEKGLTIQPVADFIRHNMKCDSCEYMSKVSYSIIKDVKIWYDSIIGNYLLKEELNKELKVNNKKEKRVKL